MAEYIEKEAAIAAAFSATSLGNSAFRDVYDTVNRLRSIPAADVQPMRHGRWGKDNDCSECGCQPWFARDIHTLKYCPNCGAKMDECP